MIVILRPTALVVLALLTAGAARAQELNCDVSLNRQSLSGSEFVFLDELRTDVARYLNGRAWTNDVYQAEERIDCSVQITITTAPTQTTFSGQIVVQASRPIYGTGQRSTTVLLSDDRWDFSYTRGQSLIYDPNRYDALTSVLDFYALLLLGYDYDTFEALGGTPYFERARRIAELAVTSATGSEAWGGDGAEERTRFGLIQQLLDPVFEPLRQAQYAYHFIVLDHFVIEPQTAWTETMTILQSLHELHELFNRRRYATDVFYGAKYQELTTLLLDAPQRNQAYALLAEMDAAHLGTYDQLVNG